MELAYCNVNSGDRLFSCITSFRPDEVIECSGGVVIKPLPHLDWNSMSVACITGNDEGKWAAADVSMDYANLSRNDNPFHVSSKVRRKMSSERRAATEGGISREFMKTALIVDGGFTSIGRFRFTNSNRIYSALFSVWILEVFKRWMRKGVCEPMKFMHGTKVEMEDIDNLRIVSARRVCPLSNRNSKDVVGVIPLYKRLFNDWGFLVYEEGQLRYSLERMLPFVLVRVGSGGTFEISCNEVVIGTTKVKSKIIPRVQKFIMEDLLQGSPVLKLNKRYWKLMPRKSTVEETLSYMDRFVDVAETVVKKEVFVAGKHPLYKELAATITNPNAPIRTRIFSVRDFDVLERLDTSNLADGVTSLEQLHRIAKRKEN